MSVLHILHDLSGGGAERLVLELCRRSERPCEVATVSSGGELAPAFVEAGIRVRCAERRPGRLGLRAVSRLARWAREFDIVHSHLWAGDSWGRLAASLARGPVLVNTEHNIDLDEGWAKRRFKVLTSPLVARHIAVSGAVRDWWVEEGVSSSRFEVVPNGVDLERFGRPWQGGGPVVAIGRLVPQKGLDTLARAAASMEHPVHIAGVGPQRAGLERLLGSAGRCLGAVDDVPELLRTASVLVVPSRWEGFGLVALEGMAAGVPVVTTGVGGLDEVVGDAALRVPVDDPGALSEAVRQVLREPAIAQQLSRAGRSRAARFGMEAMMAHYERIYAELTT